MPQYLAPGVYIEEVPGQRPIEGVGTATGAFVGVAERGPIGQAVLVTNWTQFTESFGGYIANAYLAYAVNQFFTEGGTRCYVVRTCHYTNITDARTLTARSATLTFRDRAATPADTLRIEALSPGSWGDNVAVIVEDATKDPTNKFKLRLLERGVEVEEPYDELTVDTAPGRVNGTSTRIRLVNLNSPTVSPANRPALSAATFNGLSVTALAKGLSLEIVAGTTVGTFKIVLRQGGSLVEADAYDNLALTNVERRINGISKYIRVAVTSATPPTPVAATPLPLFALTGGWDGLVGLVIVDRAGQPTLKVSAWREGVTIDVANATTDAGNRFKITVKLAGDVVDEFDNLTMSNAEQEINESPFIEVEDMSSATAAPGNRPAVQAGTVVPSGLNDSDFVGDEGAKNGLHAFDAVDDINIVAIPDRPGDREVILAAYTYCQNRKDCFFVADPPLGLTPQQVQSFKEGTGDYAGNAFNSSYAALYYPWIFVTDPRTNRIKRVPPSGAVIGTYSYTDVARGVHKAPAGISEGYLNSAVAVERLVTKGEQELLNPIGVNVIRSFPGAGIVVWGARTLSADPEWKYVNVRRLLLFIEESIEQGTQWVVFEPNDRSLWAKVRRDVTAFLGGVWQSGALFGATAGDAFFVKVDDENNPPEVRDLGRLIIDVGVAPVKPAEFVIVRISQKTQGAKA